MLTGATLPADDAALAELLDRPEGAVVARVTPADKFRIARVLRERGHVVAMTGDGVNDAPALREADVGVAMGASGSDVARESADLVLLDDHFGTIVTAVELGRSTFRNVRRFLTYHLTDNVAELTPFALWALTGGRFPLAIGVLQVLALDIDTDMLLALALGAEPANPRIMDGRAARSVVDRPLILRAFGLLGAVEAVMAMTAFTFVLVGGGWGWGDTPSATLLATASGTAFAAISIGRMANAFACRSASRPVWRLRVADNPLLLWAVAAEVALMTVFLGVPGLRGLLGGGSPEPAGPPRSAPEQWSCSPTPPRRPSSPSCGPPDDRRGVGDKPRAEVVVVVTSTSRPGAAAVAVRRARRATILLTHVHPDHEGSALRPARTWDCAVHMHPNDLPMARDFAAIRETAMPLERRLLRPLMRVIGTPRRDAWLARGRPGTPRGADGRPRSRS